MHGSGRESETVGGNFKQGTGLATAWVEFSQFSQRSRYVGSPEIGRLNHWPITSLQPQYCLANVGSAEQIVLPRIFFCSFLVP